MRRWRLVGVSVFAVLGILAWPAPAARAQGAGVVNCDKCHGNRDFIDPDQPYVDSVNGQRGGIGI